MRMVLVEIKIGKNCDICKCVITIILIIRNSKSDSEKLAAAVGTWVPSDQIALMALNMVGKIT